MITERKEKFMDFLDIETCVFSGLTLLALLLSLCFVLSGKTDKKAFQTSWSVVEGSSKEATVVKSQLGMEPHYYMSTRGRPAVYYEYTSYITIKTEDGKAGTFMGDQENPIAGLSIGNDCTLCIKQYSGDDMYGVTDGDTAYFINDVMVYYCAEEDLSKAFLRDFD